MHTKSKQKTLMQKISNAKHTHTEKTSRQKDPVVRDRRYSLSQERQKHQKLARAAARHAVKRTGTANMMMLETDKEKNGQRQVGFVCEREEVDEDVLGESRRVSERVRRRVRAMMSGH
jgi:hypothetical protein